MGLSLQSRTVGDVRVIQCRGRIVAGTEAQSLQDHVRKLMPGTPHLVLQLGEVDFIDSSGLGTLVRLRANAHAAGGDIKLCAVPPAIAKLLQVTNLHRVFEMHASDADAVAASYQRRRQAPNAPAPFEKCVLCVEESGDVLAYLAELLRREGYHPLTSGNVSDAQILFKTTKPRVVILGARVQTPHHKCAADLFGEIDSAIPVIVLEDDFSTREAGEAGSQLLERLRALMAAR
jgi:anti-sigma B factor antagonist